MQMALTERFNEDPLLVSTNDMFLSFGQLVTNFFPHVQLFLGDITGLY